MVNLNEFKTKICIKCAIQKDLIEFHRSKIENDGYKPICKECRRLESRKYYDKNKEKIRNKIKKYRDINKSYIQTNKKYKENNKEFVLKLKREWSKSESGKKSKKLYYDKNKDDIKNKVRNRRLNNNDKYREFDKIRRNKQEYKKYMSNYIKKHKKLNPHIYAWRSVLNNTLKRFGTKKEEQTIKLLGYSAIQLKEHLENNFISGMTWDNWGEWHIDHIKPVSSFDRNEKMNIVNSLSNLTPIWAIDNLKKGNKIVNNLKNNKND